MIRRNKKFTKIGQNVSPIHLGNTPKQDRARNLVATLGAEAVGNNPNIPASPITCSGTSFQCKIPGSGKTRITNTTTYPQVYDHLGTPIKEGGMLGKHYQPDVILNWQNNISTQYTKDSLKTTYGFENFQ